MAAYGFPRCMRPSFHIFALALYPFPSIISGSLFVLKHQCHNDTTAIIRAVSPLSSYVINAPFPAHRAITIQGLSAGHYEGCGVIWPGHRSRNAVLVGWTKLHDFPAGGYRGLPGLPVTEANTPHADVPVASLMW